MLRPGMLRFPGRGRLRSLAAALVGGGRGRRDRRRAGVRASLPFGVNVMGYLAGQFGVAEAARGLVHALRSAGVPHVLNNLSADNYQHGDTTFGEFSTQNPYRVNLVHVNADAVPAVLAQKGARYFRGRYNIGVWYWELSRFPDRWLPQFDWFDEIWVTSAFCAESIGKAAPIPVVKITAPIVLDEASVRPDRGRFGVPEGAFAFVCYFDFNSVFERKNPLAALRAFREAFPAARQNNDVVLLVKTINGEHAPEKRALLEAEAGPGVRFIHDHLSRAEMLGLFAVCDCQISLHRSEGLGLGLAESMYLGKPVIATGYSGNLDFMNVNNSLLVRYRLVELTEDQGPYEKGSVWAEPDVEHAAQLLRQVAEDRALAAQIGRRASQDIRTRMTPEVTGREIQMRLTPFLPERRPASP